jgi:Fe-S cluster biogenesis protein NfuA
MHERIQTALNDRVRPRLQNHGGDIQLVGVHEESGIVTVRLQGMCTGCPGAQLTLQAGVERLLKEIVPEVKQVVSAPP